MPVTSATDQIGPVRSKKELAALLDIVSLTFHSLREQSERYAAIVGQKNFWVIRRRGAIVGGCALLPMGQYFGGKSVAMTGVAAVAIAPEHRGQGLAKSLMQAALRQMHRNRVCISTLYPATLPLYRSVGYEQAGARYEIQIPAKSLIIRPRCHELQIRPVTSKHERKLRTLYAEHAVHRNGNLDRSDFIWHRIRQPRGHAAQGFLLTNQANGIEGYAYTVQKQSTPDTPYTLHVTDFLVRTERAGRQLLCFFGDHRSLAQEVILNGSPDDPMIKLLPERNYGARLLDHWMLRIVDVGAALTARGYSRHVAAEVHLDVEDDLLMANNGRFVLSVRDGAAELASGGRGDVKISIRGLAALYTSHASPWDLETAGHLTLSPRARNPSAALDSAAAVFAGPSPWLGDMF
jgi:predicted acetyltransferase